MCPDVSDARLFKSPSISNFKLPTPSHFFPTPLPLSIPFPFSSYSRLFTDPGAIAYAYRPGTTMTSFYGIHGNWLFIERLTVSHTVSQSQNKTFIYKYIDYRLFPKFRCFFFLRFRRFPCSQVS